MFKREGWTRGFLITFLVDFFHIKGTFNMKYLQWSAAIWCNGRLFGRNLEK